MISVTAVTHAALPILAFLLIGHLDHTQLTYGQACGLDCLADLNRETMGILEPEMKELHVQCMGSSVP